MKYVNPDTDEIIDFQPNKSVHPDLINVDKNEVSVENRMTAQGLQVAQTPYEQDKDPASPEDAVLVDAINGIPSYLLITG